MEEETDEDERFLNEKRKNSNGKKDDQQADIVNQERINKHSISDIENFIDNLSETSTGRDDVEENNKIVEPAVFESVGEIESVGETEEMPEEDREKTGLPKDSYPTKHRASKGMFLSKSKIICVIAILVICSVLVFFLVFFYLNSINSIDSDGDGYPDSVDYFPHKDAKVRFSIINFELNDTVNYTDETLVYFQVFELFNFSWDTDTWDTGTVEKTDNIMIGAFNDSSSNFSITYDVADDVKLHTLVIQVYKYNSTGIIDEILDLDDDPSWGLTVDYDIVSGTWTGDDDGTGVTDGSKDGITTELIDCYLEYSLTTV